MAQRDPSQSGTVNVPPPSPSEPKPIQPIVAEDRPITILTELDSYISERMKGQPKTLEEVASRTTAQERVDGQRHRLSLPDYFEAQSYDNPQKQGRFVFRWITKEKRSLDRALGVMGWSLVNNAYFPEAPKYLFTANRGVEVGDAILVFMSAKRALEIRKAPGERSRERLKSQLTQVDKDYVMMTGNPSDEKYFKPDMPKEQEETSEAKVPGVMVEGRDFS